MTKIVVIRLHLFKKVNDFSLRRLNMANLLLSWTPVLGLGRFLSLGCKHSYLDYTDPFALHAKLSTGSISCSHASLAVPAAFGRELGSIAIAINFGINCCDAFHTETHGLLKILIIRVLSSAVCCVRCRLYK